VFQYCFGKDQSGKEKTLTVCGSWHTVTEAIRGEQGPSGTARKAFMEAPESVSHQASTGPQCQVPGSTLSQSSTTCPFPLVAELP
jgi:hypothetical protein